MLSRRSFSHKNKNPKKAGLPRVMVIWLFLYLFTYEIYFNGKESISEKLWIYFTRCFGFFMLQRNGDSQL